MRICPAGSQLPLHKGSLGILICRSATEGLLPWRWWVYSERYRFKDCNAAWAASSGVRMPLQQSHRGSMTM